MSLQAPAGLLGNRPTQIYAVILVHPPGRCARLHRDDGRVQHALIELGVVVALDGVPYAPDRDLCPRHLRARRRWPAVPLREKQAGVARPACTQLTAGAGGEATGDKLAAPARPCMLAHGPLVDLEPGGQGRVPSLPASCSSALGVKV